MVAGEQPALAQQAREVAQAPSVTATAAAVDRELRGGLRIPGFGPDALTFRGAFTCGELYDGLAKLAADQVSALSAQRRTEARNALRSTVALLSARGLAALGLAILVARSITKELRPLAARAENISQGRLDSDEAHEHGPREIAVVARALNDTVTNLRRIEQQAAALAEARLDDPVLEHAAPGALGDSIHKSVHRLAEAWRDRDDLQIRLAHQANHDLLTALPNRRAALDALELALARAQRHGEAVTVLFLDLDEFKRSNDAYGHHAGDAILKLVAGRLSETVRGGDVLARLGGDEFVVITERLANVRDAVELGERLIAAVSQPFDIEGVTTHLGASVGVGIALDGNAKPLDLLLEPDNAGHRAKRLDKGGVEIFDEQARDQLAADNALELALRKALANDDLHLHYQSITDTESGEVRGFEA